MQEHRFAIKTYETDFLCIGGGIAGLMASINAADHGMRCIVMDKGDARRSGSSGLGNDHFICYIPEVHGDYETFIHDVMKLQNGARLRQMGADWAKSFFYKTSEIVKMWDAWGIPMKHDGRYYFAGHALPGRTHAFLKYHGVDQKIVLVREARKRGVEIHNRRMGYDLLTDEDGAVAGAVAVDTREDVLHVYRAKAVLLGTGLANGVFPFNRLGSIGMNPAPICLTGDGRMMAYRAGAELCNLEMPHLHAGVKFFSRSGQATWEGVLRDPRGNPVGPFFTEPNPLCGDITMEVDKSIIERFNKEGKGPVFMDMTGLTREQLEGIFRGKITNWKQVGGEDRKIVVYSRETSSGTYEFFKESVLKHRNYMPAVLSMPATGAIIQSVSQTPGAIGYVGLAYLNPEVKALAVSYDGGGSYVAPTFDNARSKSYPIVRPLYFYYTKSNEAAVRPLVDYLTSDEGQAMVASIGFIPIR